MAGATFGDDPDDLAEDIADTIYILQVIAAKAASEDLGQRVAHCTECSAGPPQPQSTLRSEALVPDFGVASEAGPTAMLPKKKRRN